MITTDERGAIVACAECGRRNRIPYGKLAEASGAEGTGRCGGCGAALPKPTEPLQVGSVAAFDALVAASPVPVVVDFWAAWCGPCRAVAPEIEKVARTNAGRLAVAKVDVEAVPALAERYRVQSIPMLAVFSQGRLAASEAGARPAPAIEALVRQAVPGTL